MRQNERTGERHPTLLVLRRQQHFLIGLVCLDRVQLVLPTFLLWRNFDGADNLARRPELLRILVRRHFLRLFFVRFESIHNHVLQLFFRLQCGIEERGIDPVVQAVGIAAQEGIATPLRRFNRIRISRHILVAVDLLIGSWSVHRKLQIVVQHVRRPRLRKLAVIQHLIVFFKLLLGNLSILVLTASIQITLGGFAALAGVDRHLRGVA